MKNNILASIALFGVYRMKNLDTYDLVAQYILATIAQKEYTSFTAYTMKDDLKELYFIEIPTGVIKSVAKNRIEGVSLSNGSFSCPRIPKDDIEQEYSALNDDYNTLFKILLDFVKAKLEGHNYTDDEIKNRFADFLVDGYSSETKLSNLYAAFIAEFKDVSEIRQKIDLLSSGLISYNGLRYTDTAGTSGAWTDKLTVYLDTEFLFSCAGYNGEYYQEVFKELYELVKEVNTSHRRRTKRDEDLIELKYFRDTREVYNSIFRSIKQLIDAKAVPDPSRKAMMKIYQESTSDFDVDIHKSKIDTVISEKYNIIYDGNDYDNYIKDPKYIIFDEKAYSTLSNDFNADKDQNKTRKLDYICRVLTIINGLRKAEDIPVFEKCRYIFLTGSKMGRSASIQVQQRENKKISLSTDIDFLISRLWFKLNKQLANGSIPPSLDIVARAQAVLTREVSMKVRNMYEDLVSRDMPESQKKTLYASLKDKEDFLEPYNDSSLTEVLAFIDYNGLDELMEAQHELKKRATRADEREKEVIELKKQLAKKEEEASGLHKNVEDAQKETEDTKAVSSINERRQKRIIIALIVTLFVVIVGFTLLYILK